MFSKLSSLRPRSLQLPCCQPFIGHKLWDILAHAEDHHDSGNIKAGITKPNTMKSTEYINSYKRLIDGNLKYVNTKKMEDPEYFKKRSSVHAPKYFLIGCSDSRVPPNELTNTEPGEIFIHRNIANQVKSCDVGCMSSLKFAVEYLKVEHIIVMGHTNCGGIYAANRSKSLGVIDYWLQSIRDVALTHREELKLIKDEKQFLLKLTEFNVRQQTLNVCKSSILQKAWGQGRTIRVSGWLCDIETGLIRDLDVAQHEWEAIKGIYGYDFENDICSHDSHHHE